MVIWIGKCLKDLATNLEICFTFTLSITFRRNIHIFLFLFRKCSSWLSKLPLETSCFVILRSKFFKSELEGSLLANRFLNQIMYNLNDKVFCWINFKKVVLIELATSDQENLNSDFQWNLKSTRKTESGRVRAKKNLQFLLSSHIFFHENE